METDATIIWSLIAGFIGLIVGGAVTAAFYELKNLVDRRDDYDETL